MEKGAKISPLQQGAQKLNFGFPAASTTSMASPLLHQLAFWEAQIAPK